MRQQFITKLSGEKFVSNDFQTSPMPGATNIYRCFADGRVGDGLASYPFAEIAAQPLAIFEAALAQFRTGAKRDHELRRLGPESCSWIAAAFAQLNVALEIFCVVRPPIEGSIGWWQWGVWSGQACSRLGLASHSQYRYADWLQAYARLPGLQRLKG